MRYCYRLLRRNLLLVCTIAGFTAHVFSQSIISNSGFESGTASWQFHTDGAATFAADAPGDGSPSAGHVVINSPGSNVQLYQTGFPLEANTQYTLTFKAYSNTGHDLSIVLHKHTSPYTNYGLLDHTFNLTTSWSVFSAQFTTSGFSGTVSDARLRFWLAPFDATGDQYFFDDVVLTRAGTTGSAPTITSHPANQSVAPGQTATFNVSASGTAPLSYQWQRNGADIGGATNASYTTPSTTLSDNGSTFRCIVSNSAGTAVSNNATLSVSGPPDPQSPYRGVPFSIPGAIEAEDFDEGGEGIAYHDLDAANQGGQYRTSGVDVSATSDIGGGYKIGWTKGSEWLEYTVNVGVAGTYTIAARIASAGNGGTFHIEMNGVNVTGPITVPNTGSWESFQTVSKTGVTLNAGQQVLRFSMDADGPTGWFGDFNSLSITSEGSSSSPTITSQPADQSVAPGQTATFSVTASGSAPLSYQWQKNGSNIAGATNSTYTTPPTTTGDNGSTFQAIVSNGFGNATSNAAVLSVTGGSGGGNSILANPGFESGTGPWSFYSDGSASFSDDAPGAGSAHAGHITISAPGSNVQLYQVGFPLEANTQYTLTFQAYSNSGHDVSVSMHQNTSPYTSFGLMDQVFNLASSWATYSVQFTTSGFSGTSTNARLRFWFAPYDASGDQYFIDDVTLTSAGSGGGGTGPTITSQPSNQAVPIGQTATFSVSASGASPLSYQWQRNGANIGGAAGSSYTTPPVSASDNGSSFRCIVSNSSGTATSNAATLTVAATQSGMSFQHRIIDSNNPRNPHCKAIGDIDGDGFIDVLAASSSNFTEGLFWYKYPSWTKYNIAGGSFSTDMQTGDVDGDGDLDVIIPKGADLGSAVYWYRNPRPSGNPTSPWQENFIGNAGAHDVEVGDLNNDGRLDVVVRLGATVVFYQNNPNSWTAVTVNNRSSEGTALGDIDGDGDLDIAINGYWLQNPSPSTSPWTERAVNTGWPTMVGVTVADINADGRKDILLAPSESANGKLAWYETSNPLTGPWTEHVISNSVSYIHTFKTADMDRDGDLDVVTAEMHQASDPDEVSVYRNDGGALNWIPVAVATSGSHNIRVGDIGNDGDIDIVGANWNNSAPGGAPIEMWENLGGTTSGLTLDSWQRRVVDSNKPWRAVFVTSADVNGDGRKDILTGGWWYQNPGSSTGTWTRNTIGSPLNNLATVYDFDGNGTMDVLGTQGQGSNTDTRFVWASNNGSGSFTILNNIQSGQGDFLQGVAVDRYQGGALDVALSWHAANQGVQALTVPTNPSTGTWTWRSMTTTSQDEQLSTGDIDRDGDTDLLLGTQWLRNDGASWSPFTLNGASGSPDRNRLADINRDGRLDAVVGFEAVSVQGTLAWYEQPTSATGTWTERIISTSTVGPMSLDVADMDGDGDIDVIVGEHNLSNPASARMLIFENVSNGTSWVQHTVFTGDEHHDGAQVVDIDNDGDLDIISIGWDNPRVELYENGAIATTFSTEGAELDAEPTEFTLHQNSPNPFNPATTIVYELIEPVSVTLTIYNMLGEEVARLDQGAKSPGRYRVTWNADNVASGMYLCRLQAGPRVSVKKMLLMK